MDDSSSPSFSHGDRFYTFGAPATGGSDETHRRNIDNGYYAVGNRDIFIADAPSGDQNWYWFKDTTSGGDYTGSPEGATPGSYGAVMAVNAGMIRNEFYRRDTQLVPGKSYRARVALYVTNTPVNIRFELQNTATADVLGISPALSGTNHAWEEKVYDFTVPASCLDNANYNLALRNLVADNQGNDFYVDDIILTELASPSPTPAEILFPPATARTISADSDAWTVPAGGSSVGNIFGNDTSNGSPATSSNVELNVLDAPAGITVGSNGVVQVDDSVEGGVYTFHYQICLTDIIAPEVLKTCSTTTVTITVPSGSTPTIVAENDDFSDTPILPGAGTPTVIGNDSTNGGSVVLDGSGTNTSIRLLPNAPAGFTIDPTTGIITVGTSVTPGNYTVPYEICVVPATNPATCDTADVTIVVSEPPVDPTIVAEDDDFSDTPIAPGGSTPPVVGNDNPGGDPIVLDGSDTNTSISLPPTAPPGFTIDPVTGIITVGTSVTPGSYTVPYEICVVPATIPATCDIANVVITVRPSGNVAGPIHTIPATHPWALLLMLGLLTGFSFRAYRR